MPQQRLSITPHSLNPVRRRHRHNVLRRGRAAREHPLIGCYHQSCYYIHPPQYGEEEQRIPVWLHPQDQHQQAYRCNAKEREEEEAGQTLPGATQVEVQADQGGEKEGEEESRERKDTDGETKGEKERQQKGQKLKVSEKKC